MVATGKWFLIYFSLFSFTTWTSAFNLDTENVMKKTGDRNSLFGFALAMHHQVTPRKELMLLVGAPKAKALSNQNANITGGLYKCPITSAERDCERVIFDNNADNDESKENQWMGVSVASQKVGGKVLVCAHRYEQRRHRNTAIESRDVTGQCYILSEDLVFRDDQFDANVKICHGRLPSHEKFGICQQGVASTFGKDSDYAVYGVPGAYYWKGIVHVESRSTDFTNFDDGPYEVGDENKRDESKVPVPQNSYLGFSLDSGKGITNQDELTFVSGAPRDKHSGAVVFLKMVRQSNTLEAEHILKGEGLASSFGYDVAVVDLNKDGWNDIVVGAPQFFDKEAEIGGAVYVYINQKGDWSNITPIRLNGTKDSMFGLAVENIGDINKDGYEDIAVGAPFTEGGKVFIYHGSSSGINTRPVQVLEGKHLNAENFGYSLAGGMDLDENNYPDIAIGSLGDSENIKDKLHPISIGVGVTINQSNRKKRQAGNLQNLLPVLSQNEPEVQFLKEGCGPDHICQSNLKLNYNFCSRIDNQDRCSPFPKSEVSLLHMPNNNPSKTKKKIINWSFSIHDCLWDIAVRNWLPRSPTNIQSIHFTVCSVNNIANFPSISSAYIFMCVRRHTRVSFAKEDIKLNVKQLIIPLCFNSAANPSQVYFGGSVTGESAMKTEEDVGSLIQYEFRIINLGKSLKNLDNARLVIMWPKEINNKMWLLYLTKITSKNIENVVCSPTSEINSLKLKETPTQSRKKREINKVESDKKSRGTFSFFSEERKYKTLDCTKNSTARCVNIKCPLKGLDSSAVLVLHSRLWNSTFLEEFSNLNYLDIIVKAMIVVESEANNVVVKNAETEVRVTVFPDQRVAQHFGVPWWIIFVAILLAILLLALLIFLLWKCGFFRKNRKGDTGYNKADIHIHPSDKERFTTDA
uniref:Integrin alpha-6-like n=1 Tax=Callorhinchus milii TaxID=7868 RepID=A0A4W3IFV3_CALMI